MELYLSSFSLFIDVGENDEDFEFMVTKQEKHNMVVRRLVHNIMTFYE